MQREYLYDRPGVAGAAGSTWLAGKERDPYPILRGIVGADVVVIGAGLCGTLTALRLAENGARVALVEARRVGSAVTGHTTAKVTAQHGLVSANVSSDARVPWLRANIAAVERLQTLSTWVGESAAFERADSHVYTDSADMLSSLEREARLYEQAGVPGGMLSASELPEGVLGAVQLQAQAQIDPVALVDGLLDTAPDSLKVFEQSRVHSVSEEAGAVVVQAAQGEVRADQAIIASHVPFFDTLLYMTRLFQERRYAFEIEAPSVVPEGMWYCEDAMGVHWRSASAGASHKLVVSGGGHKAGQGGDERAAYSNLENACRAMFHGELRFTRHWSTQDAHTPDGLPYIGKMHGRDRCYMASGFQGWGMTTSVVAADVLTSLVRNEKHDLTDMLTPARVRAGGMVKLAVENADVVAKAFTHELSQEGDPEQVPAGSGRTMRAPQGHVAVMRGEDGTLHIKRAHCTHMRCGVEFNEAEGTWDCPCHGSRYLGDGSWLHGPTRRGLDPVSDDHAEAGDD